MTYKKYNNYDPEYRIKKEMISPQVARKVWAHIQTLMRARGLTIGELAIELKAEYGTVRNISKGMISRDLMVKIKKWAAKS